MKSHQETLEESCLAMIARGRPGWDQAASNCKWAAGCAAAVLISSDRWAEIDACRDQSARDAPACDYLRENGHDPYFVGDLQETHDFAAYAAQGDPINWRHFWIVNLRNLIRRFDGLNLDEVLDAARAAGWEIPE